MSTPVGSGRQRRDAVALVREACARATDLCGLTPERVLGIPPTRVAQARGGAAAPRGTASSALRLRRRGWVVGARARSLVVLPAGASIADADRRADLLERFIVPTLGLRLLLGAGVPVGEHVEGEWLAIELAPNGRFTEILELEEFRRCADPARARPGDDVVRLGRESVARWRGHHVLELYVHPWLGEDLGEAQRAHLLRTLLGAALACRPDPCDRTDELQHVERAVALLDVLAGLACMLPERSEEALVRAQEEVEHRDEELRHARQALVRALRERDVALARRERLERHPDAAAISELLAILEQAQEIEALASVTSAVVTTIVPGALGIEVCLHPLVVPDGAGVNRMLGPLSLVVASDPPTVRFATAGGSPHPHVQGSGSPCLGLAATPVMAALARGELATAVFLLIGWARQINPRDCYLPPDRFPKTALAPGWHPVDENR